MKKLKLSLFVLFLLGACQPFPEIQSPAATAGQVVATNTTRDGEAAYPPIVGPEPSSQVAAFYYPWYHTESHDGIWEPWNHSGDYSPPLDIASEFYPLLGPYSSHDSVVVAQHLAWLRQAGIGVIISSWWGKDTYEDKGVPVLLEQAQRYGLQVAFHIEPRETRTAESLVEDIRYLYDSYGDYPAFFRTQDNSRWSPDDRSKGLFFLWVADRANFTGESVEPNYWQAALDEIHAFPEGGLVIANTLNGAWVDASHFDGLYNYATLDLEQDGGFAWSQGLPPDAWYVPSVLPGFAAKRNDYPPDTFVPRQDGDTYKVQWESALGTGVIPQMVTITSFNEWLEGSQIEPAKAGANNGLGYGYTDYGGLAPEGYLTLTRDWIERYQNTQWQPTYRARVKLTTSSDWTFIRLTSGGAWVRPTLVSASDSAIYAGFEGERLTLRQALEDAEAGAMVELVMDLFFTNLDPEMVLEFAIGRGHVGSTQLEIFNALGEDAVSVESFWWGGINPGDENLFLAKLPVTAVMTPMP